MYRFGSAHHVAHVKIILGYTHLGYTDLRVTSSGVTPFVGEKVSTKVILKSSKTNWWKWKNLWFLKDILFCSSPFRGATIPLKHEFLQKSNLFSTQQFFLIFFGMVKNVTPSKGKVTNDRGFVKLTSWITWELYSKCEIKWWLNQPIWKILHVVKLDHLPKEG